MACIWIGLRRGEGKGREGKGGECSCMTCNRATAPTFQKAEQEATQSGETWRGRAVNEWKWVVCCA